MSELKPGWTRVKFGEVVRLVSERCADPLSEGIERYIGLEHLEPGELRVRSWGDVADGVTFTSRVRPGQVLFGKRPRVSAKGCGGRLRRRVLGRRLSLRKRGCAAPAPSTVAIRMSNRLIL